jgi:DNA primase
MDVIALHQAGLTNAVAPLGTAFTEEQAALLHHWAERINLVFDTDAAGRNAAVKAIITARSAGLRCYVVTLTRRVFSSGSYSEMGDVASLAVSDTEPVSDTHRVSSSGPYSEIGDAASLAVPAKDPADILLTLGEEALNKLAKHAIIDFDFLAALSLSLFNTANSDGIAKAVAFLFPFVQTLESEVARTSCFAAIADKFGLAAEEVAGDFAAWQKAGFRAGRAEETAPREPVKMSGELYLLTAVFVNAGARPGLFDKVAASLSPEDLEDANARELYIALKEWRRNDSSGVDALLACIQNEELRQFVTEKAAGKEFSVNIEQVIEDSLRRLTIKKLERKRRTLSAKMRIAKSQGQNLDDLLAEKMDMDDTLSKQKEGLT